jgi:Putative transposase
VSTKTKGYLLPVRAVRAVFAGKMLAYIDRAVKKEEIRLPEGMSLQRWSNLKNKLGRVKWNVNIRERYDHGNAVLIYLARYIRGGAISNKRIVSQTIKSVTFRHRVPGTAKQTFMTMSAPDFIQRYLLHVPKPHTKLVRSWGLYAPTAKEKLNSCRLLLGQSAVSETDTAGWREYCETQGDEHPERCPVCGRRLVRAMEIPAMRQYQYPANKEAIQKAA